MATHFDSVVIAANVSSPLRTQRKTTPYMSRYEYAALINARILQLTSPGGKPLIPKSEIDNYDPLVIATKEIRLRLPSLIIRRTLPGGAVEDWLLNDTKNIMHFPRI